MNEELALNLSRAYKWSAKSIRGMLIQPDLNDSEKAKIFMNLGKCELIKNIFNRDFGDDALILDYTVLQKQVFDELLGKETR